MKKVVDFDFGDILHLVGVERKRSPLAVLLPAFVFVAVGAAVGASIGLMFAPSSGRSLRHDMGDRLGQIRGRVKSEAQKKGVVNAPSPQG
jgi:hypothetical protein